MAVEKTTIKIGNTKYKDTGGGFLLEENPEQLPVPEVCITTSVILFYFQMRLLK